MTHAAVSLRGVHVRFGATEVLRDISFELAPGAFLAIIGPNGAGKSTLLNVILGLEPCSEGSATLFGAAPENFPGVQLGYIPQVKTLDRSFPARTLELVVTGLRRAWPWRIRSEEKELALAAMATTGVAHLANRQLSQLSGGELQRVFLARTLVRRPRLLVLDEPAAGMDVSGEAAMYHILDAYQRETDATVLMITHDWEGARFHASQVLLLNRVLLGFGAPREVARDENLLRAFGHIGHVKISHGEHGYA